MTKRSFVQAVCLPIMRRSIGMKTSGCALPRMETETVLPRAAPKVELVRVVRLVFTLAIKVFSVEALGVGARSLSPRD